MEVGNPVISDNLLHIIAHIYPSLTQKDFLRILSSPPPSTVLRVNTSKVPMDTAHALLQKHFNNAKHFVSRHPLIKDILIITSSMSEHERIQRFKNEVVVDVHCGSAVLRGAHVFAAGVLAATAGVRKGVRVSVYADIEKTCRRGYLKRFAGRKIFVGNGESLFDRNVLFASTSHLSGVAIRMVDSLQPSFVDIDLHVFFPQNLPSALVAHTCNPQPNQLILDMCAAPGGKTTHLATLLLNQGTVIAIDKSEKKVKKIHENCRLMGLTNVHCFSYDSTKLYDDKIADKNTLNPPYGVCSFDTILLDPPCSGFGQRPQLRCVMTDKEIQSFPVYQKKLFRQAVPLLKKGGCLVYSTCTLLPHENEQQVAWVLETFQNLRLKKQEVMIGRIGLDGYGLSPEDRAKVQRFDHCYSCDSSSLTFDLDTIGFFIACFVKV